MIKISRSDICKLALVITGHWSLRVMLNWSNCYYRSIGQNDLTTKRNRSHKKCIKMTLIYWVLNTTWTARQPTKHNFDWFDFLDYNYGQIKSNYISCNRIPRANKSPSRLQDLHKFFQFYANNFVNFY